MSLLDEIGTGRGCSSNVLIFVDFGHFARKVYLYPVELMDKFGCFGGVGGAIG